MGWSVASPLQYYSTGASPLEKLKKVLQIQALLLDGATTLKSRDTTEDLLGNH